MKAFLLSLVTGSKSYVLTGLLAAALGAGVMYFIQELRLDAQRMRTEIAETNERNAKSDLSACLVSVDRQNEAIAQVQERAKQAQEAFEQASAEREQAEDRAMRILRERTPDNVDRCVAARESFADELRRERAQ